jgi:hypothetical protein
MKTRHGRKTKVMETLEHQIGTNKLNQSNELNRIYGNRKPCG